MKKNFLSLVGILVGSCVACCAAPIILGLLGAGAIGSYVATHELAVVMIVVIAIIVVMGAFKIWRNSCSIQGSCKVDCGCKPTDT